MRSSLVAQAVETGNTTCNAGRTSFTITVRRSLGEGYTIVVLVHFFVFKLHFPGYVCQIQYKLSTRKDHMFTIIINTARFITLVSH